MKFTIGFFIFTLYFFPLGCNASSVQSNTKVRTQSRIIKVMVIDTGVYQHKLLKPFLPANAAKDISNYPLNPHPHGTHIAGIIAYGDIDTPDIVCKDVQIISCKGMDPEIASFDPMASSAACFKRALKEHVDFVNYSGGGAYTTDVELQAIKALNDANIIVLVAAGNEAGDINKTPYYPASYSIQNNLYNVIPVMNIDYNGEKQKTSNYAGGIIADYGTGIISTLPGNKIGTMTGTSQAVAMYTHRLVQRKCFSLNPH